MLKKGKMTKAEAEQDLLLQFQNDKQIVLSALEVPRNGHFMGLMDNITIFDDLDTAREFKCLSSEEEIE